MTWASVNKLQEINSYLIPIIQTFGIYNIKLKIHGSSRQIIEEREQPGLIFRIFLFSLAIFINLNN